MTRNFSIIAGSRASGAVISAWSSAWRQPQCAACGSPVTEAASPATFFGTGLVAHVSMAHPVCSRLGTHVAAALQGQGVPHVRGGTYLCIEGPQFSTLAESQLYRSWNCSVIGMTNMPEAKLAREAELCYCSVSMVTDFDCWHPGHDAVTVDSVIRVLLGNAQTARTLVRVDLVHDDPVVALGDDVGQRAQLRRGQVDVLTNAIQDNEIVA